MAKFNLYKEFEVNLKTDQLINKFAPYNRNELLELVQITLENNKTVDDLYQILIENKNETFELLKNKLIDSLK